MKRAVLLPRNKRKPQATAPAIAKPKPKLIPKPVYAEQRPLPTLEELQLHFFYEVLSGELKYRLNGQLAGCIMQDGIRVVNIRGSLYRASHIIWFLLYGSFPPAGFQIINVNGDKTDFRRDNIAMIVTSV